MSSLVTYEEALAIVLRSGGPGTTEVVALADAQGRVLADSPVAADAIPPFANSAMDGFAVRASDATVAAVLPLAPGQAAGFSPNPLPTGHAMRIATGGVVPEGADAIVPIEDAMVSADSGTVTVNQAPHLGRFIRVAGSDLPAGAQPLTVGMVIDAAAGAILASIGATSVTVYRRPQVAVLPTGAELVTPDVTPGPAQIRESNSTAIAWAARAAGADVTVLPIAPDEPEPLRALLETGLNSDLLLTSGGVSVGERDLVRETLDSLELDRHFWGVDLKPGKPAAFGTSATSRVLSLPGNPASSMVVFALLAVPLIHALSGRADPTPANEFAYADGTWPEPENRLHAIRCRLHSEPTGPRATPTGDQGSHRITSLLGADALALIPPGTAVAPGDSVAFRRLTY